ncbi:ABC transporter permease [Glaciibacter superstes]|uniref:ABC transporter permease n=1 Tax=Glaciibacter superstes TaxID=501023 RepID=UPI0003B6580E|nr:ABC transporter permease subunit [Glaciibacter superstes]
MSVTESTRSIAVAAGALRAPKVRQRKVLLVAATALLILLIWQIASAFDASGLVPTPSGILLAMPGVFTNPSFWIDTLDTSLAILEGLAIGVVFGTLIGLLTGRVRWLRGLTAPYVAGLYAVPLLALVPLATIWLGYSPVARLALITVAALLPCIVSTVDGARKIARELEDAAFVLHMPKRRVLFDLVFPATLPYIMAGVNVAIGRAIVAAIAVEFLASVPGLGRFILINARSFHQDASIVGVFVLVVLGVLGTTAVEAARRRMAPWHNPRGEK